MTSTAKVPSQPAIAVPATVVQALDPAWPTQALVEFSGGRAVTSVEQVEYIKTMATKVRFTVAFDGSDERHAFALRACSISTGAMPALARPALPKPISTASLRRTCRCACPTVLLR